MKRKWLLILAIGLLSCRNDAQKMVSVELMDSTAIQVEPDAVQKTFDTLRVNYEDAEQLLNVLVQLPDSSMVDWDWSMTERRHFAECIRRDGYVVDSLKDYFDLHALDSFRLNVGVVDGGWGVYTYKALDGSIIVITNSIATGGSSLRYFEVSNGRISSKPAVSLFNNDLKYLWTKSDHCRENMSDDIYLPLWDFDFTPAKITIDGSWGLDSKKNSSCIDGNVLVYKFNPARKLFELESLRWEKRKGPD